MARSELAALPWVLTPPASTHNHLVTDLSCRHGVTPTRVVEADAQAVLENLVVSGVGLSLVREERARLREAAGELYLLEDARLSTNLWFVYRTDREHDPAITALIDVVQNVWPPRATSERVAGVSRRRRVGLRAEKRS